ncbi:MAG: phosphatidate cytidylyltransferase [Methylobacterium mesophilicum]|nr:phosphatidate cytidylyltransferase [Methylobacterium mesophilicum]
MTAGQGHSVPSPRVRSNLQLRVLSGAVLAVLAVGTTLAGGFWFRFFCALIGVLVFYEWALMSRAICGRRVRAIGWLALAIVVVALVSESPLLPQAIAVAAALLVAAALVERGPWTLSGGVYALIAAVPLALLRGHDFDGLAAVLILYALVWGTDSFAYFVGRTLGGPKLAPSISPGKTWSGAVGGVVCGAAAALLMAWLCGVIIDLRLVAVLLVGSVISEIGDLFESWVKRRRGVKDSSRLIPGHGGVMDRVDGLIVAAFWMLLVGGLISGFDAPARWLLSL